jgi:penicillin-binding protein 2
VVWEKLATKKPDQYYHRLYWMTWLISGLFAILFVRLVWLQVFLGGKFRMQAQSNSMRLEPRRATRGLVLDRNLKLLVSNTPSFSVGLVPALLPHDPAQHDAVVRHLAELLQIDPQEILDRLQHSQARPFTALRVAPDVDRSLVGKLEELRDQLPGAVVLSESKRSYPKRSCTHLLGYLGEITDAQAESLADKGYKPGDLVGQTGIEKVYDSVLRGEDGGQEVQVNAAGRETKLLFSKAPVPGNNLVLTLDLNLQQAAEEALGNQPGSVVALDPHNGEILALVSKPDYDLGMFTRRLTPKEWKYLSNGSQRPLTNRAIQGLYPPGSVFKLITTMAGLETGRLEPKTTFNCPGNFWIDVYSYHCWKAKGHGLTSLRRALVESCDVYFYEAGLKLTVEPMAKWAQAFGLGAATGIDLPGESAGLVPDPDWKERTQHMPWFPGNTVQMAIGQSYLLVTPLQLATMTAAMANGGSVYQPHLLKAVTDSAGGRTLDESHAVLLRQVQAKPESWAFLHKAMVDVVNTSTGTGVLARVPNITVAGKTGTAQNPHGPDHADFVSFAPAEDPQLVVAVVLENGGHGGVAAAPIAQKVYKAFFGVKS